MKTKLTLTVEQRIISRVKKLAKRRKTSVSALFEEWSADTTDELDGPPLGERLSGHWANREVNEPDPRLTYLLEKHGS